MNCIICHSTDIEEVVKENRRYYFCAQCDKLYERAIDSRYGRDVTISTQAGIVHMSVGAIIRNGDHILLLKRRAFPYGWDIPAGHVEYNENTVDAIKRELLEETSLRVIKAKLIYEGEMRGNKCRYGADTHLWRVYECTHEPGHPTLNPESEAIGWYSLEEAQNLELVDSAQKLLSLIKI